MTSERIPPPVTVTFVITRECNLRCKHCYSSATDSPHPEELSTGEAKRVIEDIAASGVRMLIFDGGEPLMRLDIYELVDFTRESGLYPLMITNATRLSSEAAKKLIKAGIIALAISVHGATARIHDSFTGIEGSWNRTLLGIQNAHAAGIPFQINTCLHHDNVNQIDKIMDRANEWGAIAIEFSDYLPIGKGKENPELMLTPDMRQHVITKLIQRQLETDTLVYYCNAIPQLMAEVEKIVPSKERVRFSRTCCDAALHRCSIFYEGTVYPCVMLQKKAGNIRTQSFQEIWRNSEVLKTLRNRDKLEGKCKICDYRYICNGARCHIFAKTGSLTKGDSDCWFKKMDIKQPITLPDELECRYCERKALTRCEVCRSPLCEEHFFISSLYKTHLCHPDVSDCIFHYEMKTPNSRSKRRIP